MKRKSNILLIYLLLGAGLAAAFLPSKSFVHFYHYTESASLPDALLTSDDITAPGNCMLLWSTDGSNWIKCKRISKSELKPSFGKTALSSIPTSFRWKAPMEGLPVLPVLQYVVVREEDGAKLRSPVRYHAFDVPKNDLPILSLYINPDDFFSEDRGIYVPGNAAHFSKAQSFRTKWWNQSANYHQRGREWERKVHFRYYSTDGQLLYASNAGARIHGNATRAYPQKSIRLTARKEYGNGKFTFDFFGNGQKKFDDLILRNGGNDWDRTLVTDAFIHTYCSKPDGKHAVLIYQDAQFCEVYLNGEYWGIHSLRSRVNEDFLALVFGIKNNKVVMAEGASITSGNTEDERAFAELMRFVKEQDLSLEEHFLKVEKEVHLDGLINYMAIETFCANTDWPANNVKQYRIKDKDVDEPWRKWNWVLWDMDYAFSYAGEEAVHTNVFDRLKKSNADVAQLFCRLSANKQFADYAVERMLSMDHLRPEKILPAFQSYAAQIDASMDDKLSRWRKPNDREKFLLATQRFLEQRFAIWSEQVKAFFKAGGES